MQFADATIYGNLTRDLTKFEPAENKSPGGHVDVAVNRPYTQGGERKTETTFVPVTVYGNIVNSIGDYLVKGRPVIVRGRLVERHWTTQDGSQRSRLTLVVSPYNGSIELLPNGNGNGMAAAQAAADSQQSQDEGGDPF